MLLSMVKVQIIGTKQCQDKTVRLLHRLGAIQIDEWHEDRSPSQERMALNDEDIRLREKMAYLVSRVEAVLTTLPAPDALDVVLGEANAALSPDWLVDTVTAGLAEVEPQVQALAVHRDELEEQLGSLPRYEATLRQLLPVLPTLTDLEHYAITAILVERRYQEALATITHELERATGGLCEVVSREIDGDMLAAVLIFPKEKMGTINELLGRENIAQVPLPAELAGQSFEQALANIRRQLQNIPHQLAEIERQLTAIARTWQPRLLTWQTLLRDRLAQIDISTRFGQTEHTFIIEGWMPERRLAELETCLAQEIGDEVLLVQESLTQEQKEQAPVVLENPIFAKPFEPLIGLLALPRYGAFDPTLLMSFFLPLFFGMILGDIAYGAILLVLLFFLRRRLRPHTTLRSLSEVLMMGAVWSIVFGFVYGEFFGTLGETMGLHPLWFDRGHDVEALFLLTLGIGAGHIVLGLGLGAWEALRQRSRHEFVEKTAMLVSLAALFLLVAVVTEYLPGSFFTPAIALLLVSLVILIFSMGKLGILLGPLELLGTVGNILSYLRIAAIGLSSIFLARVANDLIGAVGNVLVGLIIATLLHALNIALGAFSPTIQSLRLHYVEFFGKFYEGGGQPFRPFQRTIDRR